MDTVKRVVATDVALLLIRELREKYGQLLFFQSGGCCDGSSPMCYSVKEFVVGDADIYLGTIQDTPFYMNADQFSYWMHTQLIIDVVDGNGGMFSLENGTGKRFHTRSRLFADSEFHRIAAAITELERKRRNQRF
ncbi:DUF779 domain-containing protein [Noviherbaspirillum sp. CPCC 100848]|uniref:DUF779 domain-containing protein n=1 Tax=Noviherbaspirillum album TaxID=3080276 RepID=A0ABU6JH01_9BURK|nr:DUF779 domain-containing protein [Noviherbaspirillum sp. CPCC 100848]MEC4722805.1 DUF779 domain-containing protein [Noviherbaspirillum sp. CPCC 100848]